MTKIQRTAGIIVLFGIIGGAAWVFRNSRNPRVTLTAWRLPSNVVFLAEDSQQADLQRYRRKENLDDIIRNESTDFSQIMALARWTSKQFEPTHPSPLYPPWNAPIILDWIRRGKTGGYCAQYAFVFGQACQSVGYQPRYWDIAAPKDLGGHFTTEIYVPSFKRWIVVEPEWGYYYADARGRPLDALDLHAYATGQKTGVVFKEPGHTRVAPKWLALFYYIRYYLRNNFVSVPVYSKSLPTGQILFEKYRLAWRDRFTDNENSRGKAIFSDDLSDFRYELSPSKEAPQDIPLGADFGDAMKRQEPFKMNRFRISLKQLDSWIESNGIKDATYRQLTAE